MNKIKLLELFNTVDLQMNNLYTLIKKPTLISGFFYIIEPILPPSTLIDAPFVPDDNGLERYKIVFATSLTVKNLEISEESLTSLKKLFSTSSFVLFSLFAVSVRNSSDPSDNVDPGTIVFTVTLDPYVILAKPLENTLTEALDTL